MTTEQVAQFENGTHPFLQKPVLTRHGNKLKFSEVTAPHHGIIRLIGLQELKASNALGVALVEELEVEIDRIRDEGPEGPTRVVIINSEHDKTFCAGANLKERAKMTLEEANAFLTKLRKVFRSIEDLPVPVIAAVHGHALGGGLELALAAHLRVFGSTALVGLPEGRLGIVPGAGGTYRLSKAIGTSKALEMILTARRLGCAEAHTLGLCHEAVTLDYEKAACRYGEYPDESRARIAVRQKALHLAARIALSAPLAVRASLNAVRGGSEAAENAAYDTVIRTGDRNEALRAFREKRPPTFSGK